jgi:hypothetical protein
MVRGHKVFEPAPEATRVIAYRLKMETSLEVVSIHSLRTVPVQQKSFSAEKPFLDCLP